MNHPIIDIMERNGELKPNPDCAEDRREFIEEDFKDFKAHISKNYAHLIDECDDDLIDYIYENCSWMVDEYIARNLYYYYEFLR